MPGVCRNGGTCRELSGGGFRCECPAGAYERPYCTVTARSFPPKSFVMFRGLRQRFHLSISLTWVVLSKHSVISFPVFFSIIFLSLLFSFHLHLGEWSFYLWLPCILLLLRFFKSIASTFNPICFALLSFFLFYVLIFHLTILLQKALKGNDFMVGTTQKKTCFLVSRAINLKCPINN